jgi:hydrogenase maturation protease
MTPVLVAGVGNIFLGDDGFGVEVVQRLLQRAQPPGIRVVDIGIRAFDLARALEQCRAALIIDTTKRGNAPGTLYVLEPDTIPSNAEASVDGHGMTPNSILASLAPNERPRVIRILGCEPETFGDDGEGQLGLSDSVRSAVDEAVQMAERVSLELLRAVDGHA